MNLLYHWMHFPHYIMTIEIPILGSPANTFLEHLDYGEKIILFKFSCSGLMKYLCEVPRHSIRLADKQYN